MSANRAQGADIPAGAAAVILGICCWFIHATKGPAGVQANLDAAGAFLAAHGALIALDIWAAIANAWIVYAYVLRPLSFRRQGSRLKQLTGERQRQLQQVVVTSSVVALMAIFWAAILKLSWGIAEHFGWVGVESRVLQAVTIYNLGLSAGAGSVWLAGKVGTLLRRRASPPELASQPEDANSVAIGTVARDASAEGARAGEDWLVLSKRALNGNILVTGSIGSGKTQGTILPYFDQLLRKQNPKPSVLAIDPKGTFINDALAIAEKHGLAKQVLRLSLEGAVRFNPVYVDNVLTAGRYLDVAQMIRSAAVNFAGKGSGDSPFWELSAFNLTRNAIVYCCAVCGYYTLNDLYTAMTEAVADGGDVGLAERLEAALRDKPWEAEEAHNIRQALAYFTGEFRSMDHKVKTGILATATSFLGQFQEFRASQIFCPPKEARTILSMDEVVDGGKLLFFDVASPGLARAMGTFVKLHFQQSVLQRLTSPGRGKERTALLIMDEYQDVVSSGYGSLIGDDRFLAKGREANAVTIAATQSLSSIENSLGRANAAKELCQNFRTRIACHSADILTIKTFQDLVGDEDRLKKSHSVSEMSQDARSNLAMGGFDADRANISESLSTSPHREPIVTGRDFSQLAAFQALALVFDGFTTKFHRLNLKPYFLKAPATPQAQLGRWLVALAGMVLLSGRGMAFPNLCDVVKTPAFSSCLGYQVSACTCGFPPHPCTHFTYEVPTSFIEVTTEPGVSEFAGLPAASAQLAGILGKGRPYGTEGEDFSAYQAHILPVPFAAEALESLPCGSGNVEASCFNAMSEHLGPQWDTGLADARQPSFLAWLAAPKACLLAGAAQSVIGGGEVGAGSGTQGCSVPLQALTVYPPSPHPACNGWGVFYPRVGHYDGPSQTTAALMIAARMRSLGTEVFGTVPVGMDERWQMLDPSPSQCFREGQNVAALESFGLVNDRGRMMGQRPKGYLFVLWHRVSCCKEVWNLPTGAAALSALRSVCQGAGKGGGL